MGRVVDNQMVVGLLFRTKHHHQVIFQTDQSPIVHQFGPPIARHYLNQPTKMSDIRSEGG